MKKTQRVSGMVKEGHAAPGAVIHPHYRGAIEVAHAPQALCNCPHAHLLQALHPPCRILKPAEWENSPHNIPMLGPSKAQLKKQRTIQPPAIDLFHTVPGVHINHASTGHKQVLQQGVDGAALRKQQTAEAALYAWQQPP